MSEIASTESIYVTSYEARYLKNVINVKIIFKCGEYIKINRLLIALSICLTQRLNRSKLRVEILLTIVFLLSFALSLRPRGRDEHFYRKGLNRTSFNKEMLRCSYI